MFTFGLMTTFLPILAPNLRNMNIFNPDDGFIGFRTKSSFTKYQMNRFMVEPGLYQLLLYVDNSLLNDYELNSFKFNVNN